jgi:hypothetical protein
MDEHDRVAAARDREAGSPAVDLDGLGFHRSTTPVGYGSGGTGNL